MTRRYDAVFLDMGGTLVHEPHPNHEGWGAALRDVGGPSAEELERALSDVLREGLPTMRESLEEHYALWSDIYRRVLAAAGFTGDVPAAVTIMWDVRLHKWTLYPEAVQVLRELRARGLRMALVSNWSPTLDITLGRLGVTGFFDAIVCSALVGCAKPDERIFREALVRTAVDASRVLHVGDSYAADVLGARAVGMDAALLVRDADPAAAAYQPAISSLNGLLDLVAPSASS